MKFTASLRSELRKIKGASLLYLVLIVAFIIPFIMIADYDSPDPNKPAYAWDFYNEGLRVFVFAFLPLFCVLSSTLVMQIEVRNNTWKQVLTSPQSFFHILFAKFTVLQLLTITLIVTYNMYIMLGCAILDTMEGNYFLAYLDRWPELLKMNLMAYVSTIGISALSFWLALRSKNFIAPIAFGLLLWFVGPAALENDWFHVGKYVFAIPFTVLFERFAADRMFYQLLSIGYGVLFFSAAYLEFILKRTKVIRYIRRKVMPAKVLSFMISK